jgi:predicted dehydrogenase
VSLLRPERWQPLAKEMKATVGAGKLGALRYAHVASIWHWAPGERGASGDPGSFLIEQATGTIDLVRSLFDVPVARVFARDCPLEEADAASWYVSVVLFFADASQAICEVGLTSSFAANTGLQRFALTGMRGSAYFNERDADVVIGAGGVRPLVEEPVKGVMAALADWVATRGAGSDAVVDDGKETLRVVNAAAESVRTGQPVDVGA